MMNSTHPRKAILCSLLSRKVMTFPVFRFRELSFQESACVFTFTSLTIKFHFLFVSLKSAINREIKFDVTWSYVKRQTAKMTSEFVVFSSNPSLNHIKVEKCLRLFATNTNIFTLLFKELKTDGKSFIFVVCRLT